MSWKALLFYYYSCGTQTNMFDGLTEILLLLLRQLLLRHLMV